MRYQGKILCVRWFLKIQINDLSYFISKSAVGNKIFTDTKFGLLNRDKDKFETDRNACREILLPYYS